MVIDSLHVDLSLQETLSLIGSYDWCPGSASMDSSSAFQVNSSYSTCVLVRKYQHLLRDNYCVNGDRGPQGCPGPRGMRFH